VERGGLGSRKDRKEVVTKWLLLGTAAQENEATARCRKGKHKEEREKINDR
jgi:hypothetical protein